MVVALGFLMIIVGAMLLFVAYFVDLPNPVAAFALFSFLGGVLIAAVAAARAARGEGNTFLGSLWAGVRTLGRLVIDWMP